LERLERLQETLKPTEGALSEKVLYELPPHQIEGLHDMAEIRGMKTAALLQDYVERGLQSDLARHLRSERKLTKRPVPFTKLEDDRAEEGTPEKPRPHAEADPSGDGPNLVG
jgi:hypothetical protein